jgi:hypothetical protein
VVAKHVPQRHAGGAEPAELGQDRVEIGLGARLLVFRAGVAVDDVPQVQHGGQAPRAAVAVRVRMVAVAAAVGAAVVAGEGGVAGEQAVDGLPQLGRHLAEPLEAVLKAAVALPLVWLVVALLLVAAVHTIL